MLHSGGSVWGYREYAVSGWRTPRIPPRGRPQPPKLNPYLIEHIGVPGYDYRVFSGDAPEDYPNQLTQLPWACRLAKWSIYGGFIEVQLSFDGENILDTRLIRSSTMTLDSFRAFRVRLYVPGHATWWQLHAII